MATSSHRKTTSSGPQRFNDYLNGLREEFKVQSNATSTKSWNPRHFNIYLANIKSEFELMAEDIESLRKERDELEAKVEVQAKELQNVRNNHVCHRCSKGTKTSSRVIAASQLKASQSASSSSSRLVVESRSLPIPSTSSQVTDTFQQTLCLSRKPVPSITTWLPNTAAHIQTDTIPRPLPPVFPLPVQPDSGPGWSIKFNNEVEKELGVKMEYPLLHGKRIGCVKFSPDGKYLAAGCYDGKAYIYAVESGTLTCVVRNLLLEKDFIKAVCFSRDGKYLATGSRAGNLFIWDINTKYVRNAFKGHTHQINFLDFSPNGRLLVSASWDNTVRLWNMRGGTVKFLTQENPMFLDNPCYTSAVFSPDGRYVAASHRDGVVRIWGVHSGQLMRRVKADLDYVYQVVFMPDRSGLVSGRRTLKYWDVCTSSLLRETSDTREVEEQTQPEGKFSRHKDVVYSLAVSSDGRWVASGSRDRRVCIWDSRTATLQCSLKHDDWVYSVDFSPTGRYLASGERNGMVRVWRYSYITPSARRQLHGE